MSERKSSAAGRNSADSAVSSVKGPYATNAARAEPAVTIRINGKDRPVSPEDTDLSLMEFLREREFLLGVKNGCGIGVCGTCTVYMDGKAVKSCKVMVAEVTGEIITVEGMEKPDGTLHPIQQAFMDVGAIQCGFCTPGMVMASYALLKKKSEPTRVEIRLALQGNLCRCTGYQQIVDAVELAARVMKEAGGDHPAGCLVE